MEYWASLREALVTNDIAANTSIRELLRRYNVNSARGLIDRLTPDWTVVRGAFTEEDRRHMLYGSEESRPLEYPINLGDFDDVRRNADAIYERVTTADEALRMPPYPRPRWSLDLVLIFRGWIAGGMRR